MLKLAARTGRAKPSAIMVIADTARQLKASGKDVVNFSIGVPNFLPGDHVYKVVRDWTAHDSGGYGSNRGIGFLGRCNDHRCQRQNQTQNAQ